MRFIWYELITCFYFFSSLFQYILNITQMENKYNNYHYNKSYKTPETALNLASYFD